METIPSPYKYNTIAWQSENFLSQTLVRQREKPRSGGKIGKILIVQFLLVFIQKFLFFLIHDLRCFWISGLDLFAEL